MFKSDPKTPKTRHDEEFETAEAERRGAFREEALSEEAAQESREDERDDR